MTGLYNHLWQSTVFVLAALALTLALKKNRAALRYGIWFTASCKFLIPLSLLIAIGNQFESIKTPAVPPAQLTIAIDHVTKPFADSVSPGRREASQRRPIEPASILFGIWLLGAAASVFSWVSQWRRARRMVLEASPRGRIGGITVVSSPSRIEPGVFGILNPVLVLPRDIEHRLTQGQISAIVAHELSHVRRRDNLTAAIHMFVETIFWFHPAVWLIRTKLAEERERACDEAVLLQAVEPETYAEGILKVCKYYLEAPPACVSGVSGSNLKNRISAIMSDKVIAKLNLTKSALLTATAAAAVIGPLAMGFLDTSSLRAQTEQRAFDVASVKPNNSGDRQYGFNYEPGRFVGRNLPLLMYVALAYDLPFGIQGRVSGEPAWARSERFDIEGKADLPGLTAKGREVQMKLMLRTLLADRFQLRLRRETKDMPTYVLSVASNGVKLEKAPVQEKDCPGGRVDSSSCHVINGGMGRGMHGKAVDLPDIAQFASNFADRPVIDKTGLQGLYAIDTEGWQDMRPRPPRPDGQPSAEDLAMTDPTRPTLFMIFDRVGLKMDKQRGPVDYYTVEHAERPAAN